MGWPVVTVASGGLPVVESTTGGTPVTEAANGYGTPVTKVVGKPGLPVVFETIGAGVVLSPPLDGIAGVTGGWSASRNLSTAFGAGSKYTDAGGGAISSLNGQVGARDLNDNAVPTRRPTLSTAGPNNVACLDFNGSTHYLTGVGGNNFFTVSAGYLLISFIADTITLNSGTASANHPLFAEAAGNMGLFLQNTGTPKSAYSFNWDGTADVASSAVISVGTPYVAEWRHDGGNVYVRVNGGVEVSAASGNTASITGAMRMGSGSGAATFFDGKIFELATFSTVPDLTTRNALVANFMAKVGAA